LDILVILAQLLEVVGLLGFHALQGRNYGRIGRAGLYTTIAAIVLFELLLVASLFGGDVGLSWLVAVGVLCLLVGLVLYGAATLQARILPRWCGILFIILMPVGILLGDFQPIWGGLVWLALGYALWSQRRGMAAEQPTRVR
jgi:general stress protein CsbA